ncbi:MAG TPA: ATP-dependent helicase HrpB [Solimonas sp.]|nr:ATP-dependent helicase HrpB [Solimonas sp.]
MTRPLPDYPVATAIPELSRALADEGRAVLSAPPGSGKTTIVPLALLDEPWLRGKKIVMLEPRRVAARAAAARMASLIGEQAGATVGYQVRFERRISRDTRIEVITEGLLARRLQSDAELPGVGLLIFDEFHERSLDVDLALALALDARANLRPDLRILVMSATLDTQRVASLLGGAAIVEAGGKLFPVEVRHLPTGADEDAAESVAAGAIAALNASPGDVLAFLPGAREIRGAQRRLEARLGAQVRIFPLYGELSSEQQDAALRPAAGGARKVILATNIAQTSLTVEGVTSVVDSGLVRVARFDLGAGANRLETRRVSRASADQRAGRAGRLAPGLCLRLWGREQHGTLAAHDTPEILAADLSRFALELAGWGAEPGALALLDPPPAVQWDYARALLAELGALDAGGRITPHGRELLRLPAAPRRGHMLLSAQAQGLAAAAAWVAAVLDERDGARSLDLAESVLAYVAGRSAKRECRRPSSPLDDAGRGADPNAARRVRDAARQLLRLVEPDSEPPERIDEADVARIVSWAYPERIARRRPPVRGQRDIAYLCEDGGEARLPEAEPLAQSEWLVIAHWDPGPPRRIRAAVRAQEAQLLADHAARVRKVEDVRWDAQTGAVVAEQQQRLGAIVLDSRPLRERAGPAVTGALVEGIRSLGLHALPWSAEARQWQARVLSLRAWRAGEDWPDVSDDALLATLEDWLAPHLAGLSRRDHLARLDLLRILDSRFDYKTQQRLQRLAPTHVEVPTGSRLRLDYQPPHAPALEVKLQEMFGCADTPAVNEGRTKIVLHLLSPAQRPIAVTQDLAGFWARGYLDVKKDMKGRYPRHPWPDDPLAAAPTRRAKPRGT